MTKIINNKDGYSIAILVNIFNRIEPIEKLIKVLLQVKPSKLYIASDGYRTHVEGEFEKVNEVREYILANITWKCEVKTLFRENNLGCKYALHGAIQWFFKQEEKGIVLEDDILPSLAFFNFCEEMLEKYKNNKKIGSITGRNELGQCQTNLDYSFTSKFFCWGWASWSDRILDNDVELANTSIISNDIYKGLHFKEKLLVEGMIGLIKSKQVNSWAYPYYLSFRQKEQLCLIPSKNMIQNIGLDIIGAHSTGGGEDSIEYFDSYLPRFNENIIVKVNNEFITKLIEQRYLNIITLYIFSKIEYLGKIRKIVKNIKLKFNKK
jgi:hypothetical protein